MDFYDPSLSSVDPKLIAFAVMAIVLIIVVAEASRDCPVSEKRPPRCVARPTMNIVSDVYPITNTSPLVIWP